MGKERVFQMKRSRDLEDTGDGGGLAQGGSDDEGGADVVSVDDVGAHRLDQGSAGFEYCGDLPGVFGGDVEIYGDYGSACFLIFGCEVCSGGGQGNYYFKAQRA
jgi:hypothetical protein